MKFFRKYSDEDIMNAIAKGDDNRALSFLYSDVLPKVKAHILKNQGSIDEAKDIFQDAVIRFYNHVKEGKFEGKCSISTFIFGISKNLWINYMKVKNRNTGNLEYDVLVDKVNILEDLISEEKIKAVDAVLKELGENCEKLLKLSVYENLSMKEIGEKMGYANENVAKTYNYRCKQRLIQLVEGNAAILDLFGK